MGSSELSDKQRRFVLEYLKDSNATRAAARAGYSAKTARSIGQRLLTNVAIQDAVQAARKRAEERAAISGAQVIAELGIVGLSDIGNVISSSKDGRYFTVRRLDDLTPAARRCIKSLKQTTTRGKTTIQVELHPKVAALELLMGHFGLKAPEKLDVSVEMVSAKTSLAGKLDELRKRREGSEPGGAASA